MPTACGNQSRGRRGRRQDRERSADRRTGIHAEGPGQRVQPTAEQRPDRGPRDLGEPDRHRDPRGELGWQRVERFRGQPRVGQPHADPRDTEGTHGDPEPGSCPEPARSTQGRNGSQGGECNRQERKAKGGRVTQPFIRSSGPQAGQRPRHQSGTECHARRDDPTTQSLDDRESYRPSDATGTPRRRVRTGRAG